MSDLSTAETPVLFACFALNHTSVTRRLADVRGGDLSVSVFHSRTDKTRATLVSRFLSADFPRLLARMLFGRERVLWGWGPDVCLIASVAGWFRPGKTVVWDISDINPRFLGDGRVPRLLRAIETRLLRRADCLILSSARYYDAYFRGRIARERVQVVENLLPRSLAEPAPRPADAAAPFSVVYTAIFRSRRLLSMIRDVADAMGGAVRFDLYGYPDKTVGDAFLQEIVQSCPHVVFHGRYRQEDLPAIHDRAHLVFGCVDTDADENESWLLSNRLYHAVAFRRPMIVNEGTYAADVAAERRLGPVCALSVDALVATLRDLLADGRRRYREHESALPDPRSAFLDGHYRVLLERVAR